MSKSNPFDYIFLLRPLILIPCWNFTLIGAFLTRSNRGFTQEITLGLIIYTFVMGGVYILNQIMDRKTDRINKKLFLLSEGYLPVRNAYTAMVVLWITAFVLSFRFGMIFVVLIIISLVLGVLYSVPPIKLKGKPILDTLSNGIGYGMINFSVGWLLVQPFDWSMYYRFIPYFLSICAVFINTTLVDLEGDKQSGEITTAVFLGARTTSIIATITLISAIITAFHLRDLICLIPTAFSLPLFIYVAAQLLAKKTMPRKWAIASFRLPGIIFTLITAYLYPPYALVIIIVIIGMRIYYKKRFGIAYPTLTQ